ncbi:hypothetical protein G3A43_38440 [Paraburkholderia aspalathi]|uniref:hypothetical protein n=1 Tax=Paraburkholderia nemoris TaxID=2793076 RepID=UPI0019095B55|nr:MULTISPECIES: hypothetical protein [Paraburkholderia]MBK3786100.1 hypothetical protein [Paraburkholderia aspalathi]
MTESTLRKTLVRLATGDGHRSETARLNDVFDEVETALRAGVRRAAVLDALHRQGFRMTLYSFESALARLRKRRRPTAQKPADSSLAQVVSTPALGGAPEPLRSSDQRLAQTGSTLVAVPEDWLTAELTPAQYRLLSTAQKAQKRQAAVEEVFPNPYKKPA